MTTTPQTIVRCPNCGNAAKRFFLSSDAYSLCPDNQLTQTECDVCDYLLIVRSVTCEVVEAYAPGIPTFTQRHLRQDSPATIAA